MFNDIFINNTKCYSPEAILESIQELRMQHDQIFYETSMSMLCGSLPVDFLNIKTPILESASDDLELNFIQKLILAFKRLITKIKDWFDTKFKITERRLTNLVIMLRTKDYKKIEVEVPSNINKIDGIISELNRACDELGAMKIDSIVETIKSQSIIQKTVTGYQVWRGTFLNGYVNTYKRFNGVDITKIKEEIFGIKKIQSGIDVAKFDAQYQSARTFRNNLDKFSVEYERTLKLLSRTVKMMRLTKSVDSGTGKLMTNVMKVVSEYFNKNISLLTSLTVECVNVIVSTATKMAQKIGIIKNLDDK